MCSNSESFFVVTHTLLTHFSFFFNSNLISANSSFRTLASSSSFQIFASIFLFLLVLSLWVWQLWLLLVVLFLLPFSLHRIYPYISIDSLHLYRFFLLNIYHILNMSIRLITHIQPIHLCHTL